MKPLENISPTQDTPSTIFSDQSTHFTGKILQALTETLQTFGTITVPIIFNHQTKMRELMGSSNLKSLKLLLAPLA